ncbi:MAG: hypothetical protein CMI85_02765 [Candidatus Pelagibacter sp.]|nr:hypothetical protein [Candidatus Pelagibacter sp.]
MNFIDLENSYIYLNPNKNNSWRVAIKSILLDVIENNYYYLTKECRAEIIGTKPFDHPVKSEICVVVDSKKNKYNIRDIPVFKFNEFGPHYYQTIKDSDDEIFIKKCNYKNVDFINVKKKLKQKNLESLYTKFSYKYQNKEFIIFNKVEYLNFDGKINKGQEYLQPIYGYVPFLKDNKIFISYLAKYLEKDKQGDLEFILRTNKKINKFLPVSKNFIKRIIKKILFFSSPFIKISEFYDKINIDKSKLEFYEKN